MIFVIGDTDQPLEELAKLYSSTPVFLEKFLSDNPNLDRIEDQNIVIYGSFGDNTNFVTVLKLLFKSKKIIYQNKNTWSTKELKTLTESVLYYIDQLNDKEIVGPNRYIPQQNFCPFSALTVDEIISLPLELRKILPWSEINFLGAQDLRASDNPQLWIVGCSYPNGSGLKNKDDRYGQLVASKLNIPVSFLTRAGTGIDWACNQIMNADIRKNDTVIWAITGINRKMILQDKQVYLARPNILKEYDHFPKKQLLFFDQVLFDDTILLDAICDINKILIFCKKNQINLILLSHPELSSKTHYLILHDYLKKHEYFLDLYDTKLEEWFSKSNTDFCYDVFRKFLYQDMGDDGIHPGPITHTEYAKKIMDFIKNKNHIFL